jgi:hypothetical protein
MIYEKIHKDTQDIQILTPVHIFKPEAPKFPDCITEELELKEFLNGCFKINDVERLSIFELRQLDYLKI